ncbi:putative quinol monooxygenase [Amycolatopsis sp. NPDC048633]|uniref:putative quinol monooxygenase n=1 Tax=Amycolatopsis sp. NPDC048633 TaxID=3157095 RepID=UPI0033DD019D
MPELQIIARHTLPAGKVADLLPLYRRLAEASRTEPGNLAFEVYRDLDDDHSVVLLERYTSPEAFEAHRQTPHFKELVLEQLVPNLEHRTIESYEAAN